MKDHRTVFVSTAIPFVNSAPHVGFALEVVLADAIARHARARGRSVCFSSGTDDHSLKNVRAAEAAGVPTREFVERAAAQFEGLGHVLGASYDEFVRTSVDPRHAPIVETFWNACAARGDLEKRKYRGLYCAGCEEFVENTEICPEHGTPPEIVEEENWFFLLSRYRERIHEALTSGAIRIHPPGRANEVLRLVEKSLPDVSVSRSQTRARGWGLPVPNDPTQVIYVWFDALANYVTALGVDRWREAERRVHVVGKGIARFHAVLWPALLLAADLPLPTDLVVHGYVTVDGKKIGKSLGNAIDPNELVARFGRDALRAFLLRHVGPARDADLTPARIASAYASELADDLGNLLARTLTLVRTALDGRIPSSRTAGIDPSGDALVAQARALDGTIDAALERFAVDDALAAIFAVVASANGHLARTAPWSLAKRRGEPGVAPVLEASLHAATFAIAEIGRALGPFLPDTSEKIARALAAPAAPPPILFPKTAATLGSDGPAVAAPRACR